MDQQQNQKSLNCEEGYSLLNDTSGGAVTKREVRSEERKITQ